MKLSEMLKLGFKGFKPSDIKTINESGINTDEVIKLAESGYSIADVNELISLAGNDESVQPGNEAPADQQGPVDHAGSEGEESENNYNEKLSAQSQEIESLKAQLKAVQLQNSTRNLGGAEPKDPRKEVQEIFRQIY